MSTVSRLVEFQIMIIAARPWQNTNPSQAVMAFFDDEIIFEDIEVAHVDIIAMGQNFLPILPSWFADRCRHEAEVSGIIIGANDETLFEMIEVILVPPLARQEYFKFPVGIAGIQIAVFLCQRLR